MSRCEMVFSSAYPLLVAPASAETAPRTSQLPESPSPQASALAPRLLSCTPTPRFDHFRPGANPFYMLQAEDFFPRAESSSLSVVPLRGVVSGVRRATVSTAMIALQRYVLF